MTQSRPDNPTLHDVIDIMDTRFDAISSTLVNFNDRMDGLDARMGNLEHKVGNIEVTVLEMQEDLSSALTAIDRDTETLYDHEHRITKLEEADV